MLLHQLLSGEMSEHRDAQAIHIEKGSVRCDPLKIAARVALNMRNPIEVIPLRFE
jgi:hypothetical protein